MNDCRSCANYRLGDLRENKPRHCAIGHDDVLKEWWQNNGHKQSGRDSFDELDCFEQTDLAKSLDKYISLAKEVLDLIIEHNKESGNEDHIS